MDAPEQRIVLEAHLPPATRDDHPQAGAAAVQLDLVQSVAKTELQRRAMPSRPPLTFRAGDVFHGAYDWAYRRYRVSRLPAGPAPDRAAPTDAWPFWGELVLFNVVVALEWHPDPRYLSRLSWAFRRASDLLFDSTNGWMAFGQVIIGGPEWLGCADIQLMAANRLLARSWVGALRDEANFLPIRLGRGLWDDQRRGVIEWDEPEGYRTIIHEWGHYALHLHDDYLETRQLVQPSQLAQASVAEHALVRVPLSTVVMPQVGSIGESIMSNQVGASELLARQWRSVSRSYGIDAPFTRLDGPYELPLPLPAVGHQPLPDRPAAPALLPAFGTTGERRAASLPPLDGRPLDQCWLYVLPGTGDTPTQVLAQGTLEARSSHERFPLYGAAPGDTLLLVAPGRDRPTLTLRGTLAGDGLPQGWHPAQPAHIPRVTVVPLPSGDQTGGRVQVLVDCGDGPPPSRVAIFPLGQPGAQGTSVSGQLAESLWQSDAAAVPSLDGHVLLSWGAEAVQIYPFSQGGGPQGHSPAPANPITAGSSDGSALLFFDDKADGAGDYSAVKVVTTIHPGAPSGLPTGAAACSAAFAISSNVALPQELSPTLVLYFDTPALAADEAAFYGYDLCVCRLAEGAWHPVATYTPLGYPFAAIPLDARTAPALLAAATTGPRIEHYLLCRLPRH